MYKFQAQIKQTPPVTMLHTLTCPEVHDDATCTTGDVLRVVRARNVAEAVLDLIETYMTNDVRRKVTVCSCASHMRTLKQVNKR